MATETKIIGKISITPRGVFSLTTPYTMLDLVYYKNSSYVCIASQSQGTPPVDSPNWVLVVKGMYPLGVWDSSLEYEYMNLVTKTSSSVTKTYLCVVQSTTEDPATSADWLPLT